MDANKKDKVLLVEDNILLRNVLKDKLTIEGFSVLIAKNGKEGLQIGLKQKPDIIILDVIMPKTDGIKMLRKLRENSWGKTVPVLLLSNDDNPVHIKRTLKDNAANYLIKLDWELKDIIKRIKEILNLL